VIQKLINIWIQQWLSICEETRVYGKSILGRSLNLSLFIFSYWLVVKIIKELFAHLKYKSRGKCSFPCHPGHYFPLKAIGA